ncbi:MAG: M48 family metalloprotease [Alphaproteobacteria bacterium]|nr:M48 family metalloprotease [Alphaproteobacteria bacterium]
MTALLLLLACTEPEPPPPAPAAAAEPAPAAAEPSPAKRPLPSHCTHPLGLLAQQAAMAVDQATLDALGPLSIAEERALGQALAEQTLQRIGASVHPAATARAAAVLERLDAAFPERRFPHRVRVLDDPGLGAVALPGGEILLRKGLIDTMVDDDDQLAAVIGHEVAHVELRHAGAVYQYLAAMPELREDAPGELLVLARHGFSATQELEADRLGVTLAWLAGYDPARAVALWEKDWPAPGEPSPLVARAMPAIALLDTPDGQRTVRDMALGLGVPVEELLPEGTTGTLVALMASHPPAAVRACVMRDTVAWLQMP